MLIGIVLWWWKVSFWALFVFVLKILSVANMSVSVRNFEAVLTFKGLKFLNN